MAIETVRRTKVRTSTRALEVSTAKLDHRRYDTVVFDISDGKQHTGKRVGTWVIDHVNKYDETRETAMDTHRAAVLTARDEPIQ